MNTNTPTTWVVVYEIIQTRDFTVQASSREEAERLAREVIDREPEPDAEQRVVAVRRVG